MATKSKADTTYTTGLSKKLSESGTLVPAQELLDQHFKNVEDNQVSSNYQHFKDMDKVGGMLHNELDSHAQDEAISMGDEVKIRRMVMNGVTSNNSAFNAHRQGDAYGAQAHLKEAADHFTNAAKALHQASEYKASEFSPAALDVAVLGAAHKVHSSYVTNEAPKGKK